MNNYICIKNFSLPAVDGDGFITEERFFVKTNSEWEESEDEYRLFGDDSSIRLENPCGEYMEIDKETIDKYFEIKAN